MEKITKDEIEEMRRCFGLLYHISKYTFYCILEISWKYIKVSFEYIIKQSKRLVKLILHIIINQYKLLSIIVLGCWCVSNEITYKTEIDKLSKKSYYDSERIYRLQNDSIALRNFKNGKCFNQKPKVIYLVKKVFVKPETSKKDTI